MHIYKKSIAIGLVLVMLFGIVDFVPVVAAKKVENAKVKTTEVSLNKRGIILIKGKSTTLNVRVKPLKAKNNLKWKTSNKSVVIIKRYKNNLKVKIIAKKAGVAKITAYNGKKKSSCKINVRETSTPAPTEIPLEVKKTPTPTETPLEIEKTPAPTETPLEVKKTPAPTETPLEVEKTPTPTETPTPSEPYPFMNVDELLEWINNTKYEDATQYPFLELVKKRNEFITVDSKNNDIVLNGIFVSPNQNSVLYSFEKDNEYIEVYTILYDFFDERLPLKEEITQINEEAKIEFENFQYKEGVIQTLNRDIVFFYCDGGNYEKTNGEKQFVRAQAILEVDACRIKVVLSGNNGLFNWENKYLEELEFERTIIEQIFGS